MGLAAPVCPTPKYKFFMHHDRAIRRIVSRIKDLVAESDERSFYTVVKKPGTWVPGECHVTLR